MMSNWNMTMWWFFYGGVPSAFLARYGLAPFFRTMGIYTGNDDAHLDRQLVHDEGSAPSSSAPA